MENCKKSYSIVSIVLIIFFIGLMSASVAHAENYTFVTKWGSSGSGDGQFKYPTGIAVDSSGDVYVADTQNSRIQKFDNNGIFLKKWGSYGSGAGQFKYPSGIVVDSSGTVYVADYNDNRINKFDSNGTFLAKLGSQGSGNGQFYNPYDVAVDSSGNIYVADSFNNRIQKFDSNGTFLTKWGSQGSGNGQFSIPYGVAVDSSGNVYVADTNNNRIQKFDSNGTFLTKWGSYGAGHFAPRGIAVDSSGNIYVADTNSNCIHKFDSNGIFITKLGSYGVGDGQFYFPYDVAVDSSGNVYIADTSNQRIQKFTKEKTTPVPPIITWNNPADITYGMALNSTQLNAVASVPGTFVYTPPVGTVLSIGTHILHVDFTPTDAANYSNASKDVTINVLEPPVLPVANFSTNLSAGYAPLSVQFTDLSDNADTVEWDFENDGVIDSIEVNPIHEFTNVGTYTVNLTASNENGTGSKLDTITVLEPPALPVANFSSDVTEGNAPLTVHFTDLSTNATSVKWDFGDGSNSEDRNPVHEYSDPGTYTVSLAVSNANGTDLKTATIIVFEKPVFPVANFASNVTNGVMPLTVLFNDMSTGDPTLWKWNFGDKAVSTEQNPVHTYSKAGNYTVKLTVNNSAGSNSVTKPKYITVIGSPVSAFSASPTSGNAPLKVQFKDKSTGSPTSWKWTFGDETTSTQQNPLHQYSKAGKYTVSLTVTNIANSNTSTKESYINVTEKPVAAFSAKPTSGKAPLTVVFIDKSANGPTSWKWSFGDGKTSTEQNPKNQYLQEGNYTVKLTVKNAAGSNTTTKTNYINVTTNTRPGLYYKNE